MRPTLKSWAVLIALAATLVVNYLATTLPLGGKTTGELSDQYPIPITPAGYAFAIWGLIYLGLILFALYQLLPAQRDNPLLREIRGPFLLSSLANMAWIFFWHYEWVPLSLLAMGLILLSLLTIYRAIQARRAALSPLERWTVLRPFSLYLGWITVATVLNVATTLYSLGWRGAPLSPTMWSIFLLGVVALLAAWVTGRGRDPVYGAVVIWALLGIVAKPQGEAVVAWAAGSAALLVAGVIVALLLRPTLFAAR